MINREVYQLLSDPRIQAPAYQFEAPENAPRTRIVYNYISDRGEYYEEGDETMQRSEVQIDIFHDSNYTGLLKTVLEVAKEKGFYKGNGWGRRDRDLNISYYTLRLIKEIEHGN